MMKKKVLMPLLMAGMMVASVMSLDSCNKKEEEPTVKNYFESGEGFFVDEVVRGDRDFFADCPYCEVDLAPGDVHWHAFGEAPAGTTDWYTFLPGDPQPVYACSGNMGANACPYSGLLEGDAGAIQYYLDLGYSYFQACAKLEPRFHGHRVRYALESGGNDGGSNVFHVGGGVPFWHTNAPVDPLPGDPNP